MVGQCFNTGALIKNAWRPVALDWIGGRLVGRQWTQTNDGSQAATTERSLAMPTSLIYNLESKRTYINFLRGEKILGG